jgi:Flp pilus assembly pilin Flp
MTDDDEPFVDITNFKTFVVVAVLMILFGAMVGAGIYMTFSGLNVSPDEGLAVVIVLFITCGIIAYIPYLYRDWKMKWGRFAPDDDEDEDDPE